MPGMLLTGAIALIVVASAGAAMRGMARVRRLSSPHGSSTGPERVAVIVAARDEARTIEPALRSLLAQAKSGVRVIVVDDRSSDGTSEILVRLNRESQALSVVRVDELPAGWLGKNHALAKGADAAGDADFLLFTDADVVFAPGAVRAAVGFATQEGLDHVAGVPRVVTHSYALGGMVTAFAVLFGLFTRPWRVRDPNSSAAVGVGALNLVRRAAYESSGGHASIRMRIDDDVRLGRLLKENGARSDFVIASDVVSVEWYPSLAALVRGLRKNAFAALDYRVSRVVLATVVICVLFLLPFALVVLPGVDSWTRASAGVVAAAHLAGASQGARQAGLGAHTAWFLPLGLALFLFILWDSTLRALITRRVRWRGTDYALSELRTQRSSP